MSPTAPSRPELLALLDAIKDNPDEDTPRLVLADWLDEQGNELDSERAAISTNLRLSSDRIDEAVYGVLARLAAHDAQWWLWGTLPPQQSRPTCAAET